MPDYHTDIISDVRFITDYPDAVFSDAEVKSGVEFSEKEILSMLDTDDNPFTDPSQKRNALRALMWATCYHLKVKTGELGGMPMAIGDVDMSHFSDRGEHYSQAIDWISNFEYYLARLNDAPRSFGGGVISRSSRTYGGTDSYYQDTRTTK